MLTALKNTIASFKVSETLVREPLFIRTDWISLLKVLIKFHSELSLHFINFSLSTFFVALFADAVKLMFELGAVDANFNALTLDLPEHQSDDVLQLGKCAHGTPIFHIHVMSAKDSETHNQTSSTAKL
jgi:hypothetical protein